MRFSYSIIILTLFVSACCKEDLNTLTTWKNSRNLASGYANGKPWEGYVKLGADGLGTLSISLNRRNSDSILVEYFSFHNIKPKVGVSKLNRLQSYAIPASIFSIGYADVFEDYDPDTTRTNILEIEQFDLDRGIIKGKLTAFYRSYRWPSAEPWRDTMQITNMTFTYQR